MLIHNIYSRQIVAERFSSIAWAVILWFAALASALVCGALRPEQAAKPYVSLEYRLELAKRRSALTPAMLAQEKRREKLKWLAIAVCAACGAFISIYFFDPSSFASTDLEPVMGAMLGRILPLLAVAFAALAAVEYLKQKSLGAELSAAKDAPKKEAEPEPAAKARPLAAYRAALFIIAAALLIAGVVNGGMRDVFVKAVNICTECIGLG